MKNHQLFWFCPSCTTLMKDTRFRNTTRAAYEAGQERALDSHSDILKQLKSEILTELKSEIRTNFTALFNSNSYTPKTSHQIGVEPRLTKKRRLFSPAKNVLPKAQPELMQGTGSTLSPSTEIKIVPKAPQKFWLYLSRIAPEVSVDQVAALAKKRMGTDDIQAFRLVAKNRDVTTLSFISFKIGMSADLKPKALSSTTWPKGIVFREFSGDSSNSFFWRPRLPSASNDPLNIPVEAEMVVIE